MEILKNFLVRPSYKLSSRKFLLLSGILCTLSHSLGLQAQLHPSFPVSQTLLSFCSQKSLESLPLLQGGRVKPLLVHAQESFKFLINKTSWEDIPSTTLFCYLGLQSFTRTPALQLTTPVEHVDVRKFLNLPDSDKVTGKAVSFETLGKVQENIRAELMRLKVKDSYQKELEKLFNKIHLYQEIIQGNNWTLPSPSSLSSPVEWNTLSESLEKAELLPLSLESSDQRLQLQQILNDAQKTFVSHEGDGYLLELTYVKLNLFTWTMVAVLLALFTLILFKQSKVGLFFTSLALLLQLVAITMRVFISGRAPITNMYETVMFSGFGAVVLAGILTLLRREKSFLLAGLSYNLCCLLMMKFANNMLSSAITPLVPVLRDNFWLSTHVTMVILSYAALALSWLLSNMVLIRRKFAFPSPMDQKEFLYYNSLIYSCLKFGVVLLSGGVILGGVWADYSWGRFWGWDPKETWSLIVLLIYMAILHGKQTTWISQDRFVFLTAGAFMSVMFAWFGVNYILASGLHSYGFSQGGAVFLITFFSIQLLVLIVAGLKPLKTPDTST